MTQPKSVALFLVIRPSGTKEEFIVNAFKSYQEVPADVKTAKSLKVRRTEMSQIQAWNTLRRLGKINS